METAAEGMGRGEDAIRRHVQRALRELMTDNRPHTEIPTVPSGGALVVHPWLRFHIPLIEPDMQICRVARPLLAFAPTEPTVRRYRSGLFRKDLRRVDHCRHAWWITGSGRGKAIRSRR